MRTSTSAADAVVDANPAATANAVKVRREILDILLFLSEVASPAALV
jgi:hypothetical protein